MSGDQWITVLSLLLAILVVIDRIRWSARYRETMEARITQKDEQIAILELLSSPKIMEHFQTTRELLEQQIGDLEAQIQQKDDEIANLPDAMERARAQLRLEVIEERRSELQEELERVRLAEVQAAARAAMGNVSVSAEAETHQQLIQHRASLMRALSMVEQDLAELRENLSPGQEEHER